MGSKRVLRAAVVGTGTIARAHLACLNELPTAEVVGVCDRSPATAEMAAHRFGVRRWYTEFAELLAETRPDVVHVTTPPGAHFRLAAEALSAGADVVVEKPAAVEYCDVVELAILAEQQQRRIVEDYNYLFDASVRRILQSIETGEFGDVVHVDVWLAIDILGPDSVYADPNNAHASTELRSGAIGDFLSHLASLAYLFVGPHRKVHTIWEKRQAGSSLSADEFRALIHAQRGTASLAFSGHSQPDGFWLQVHGTRMRATANLFEPRLTIEKLDSGPRPLLPIRNTLRASRSLRRAAYRTLWRKLSGGPGVMEGLWTLLDRTYGALLTGTAPPVTHADMRHVNRLVDALQPDGSIS